MLNNGVTMEETRKTLKAWATELNINPINIPPGSENETMEKDAALGVFERRALGRNIGKLGSWLGKKMGVQAIPETTIPSIQSRIMELQKRNPALAARLNTVLKDAVQKEQGAKVGIDAEIAASLTRLKQYKAIGNVEAVKDEAAFLRLLRMAKAQAIVQDENQRVRP